MFISFKDQLFVVKNINKRKIDKKRKKHSIFPLKKSSFAPFAVNKIVRLPNKIDKS